ncbi:hypothetical protein [Endozoicomonas sp. SCSIO W0465]|uniref:hypothetical protein n=1 Tax=Endozoicomonas sp. SCSIO W0465 TaxID=2918516 RepID=UPI002075DDAC|nr:hypothetical protein [Endozoicomonas sp. SCSIO W0465]USE35631.1 hypothetical protein MJO57_26720 [Endozoicomonas sp. SCSIO W0465]
MSSIKFKDNPADFDQHLMFPSNIFDLLPPDHDCFVFEEALFEFRTAELSLVDIISHRQH